MLQPPLHAKSSLPSGGVLVPHGLQDTMMIVDDSKSQTLPNEVAGLTAGEDSNLKSNSNSNHLVGEEKRSLSDCTGRDLKMSSPRFALRSPAEVIFSYYRLTFVDVFASGWEKQEWA